MAPIPKKPPVTKPPAYRRQWAHVVVEWRDAHETRNPEHTRDHMEFEPSIRRSIGFVVVEDADRITITNTDDRNARLDTDCECVTDIPRCMVASVTDLDPR